MIKVIFSLSLLLAHAGPSSVSYEAKISDRQTFLRLQRTYHSGRFDDIPHVLFLIDRKSKKSYFANSGLFDFHDTFARSLNLTKGPKSEFFRRNYVDADRPLIIGTLTFFKGQYFFEFSESDHLNSALLKEAYEVLKAAVYAPILFKPNTLAQEELRKSAPEVASQPIAGYLATRPVEIYHVGTATGVVVYSPKDKPLETWDANSIVVFEEAPVQVVPLAASITLSTSSPLAHVHMLAGAWKVPDVRWSRPPYQSLVGQWATLTVDSAGERVSLRKATEEEIAAAKIKFATRRKVDLPKADLEFKELTSLKDQRRGDSKRFGAKSANLGEMHRIAGLAIPKGFSVPFCYYAEFFATSGARAQAEKLMQDATFTSSDEVKKKKLEELRQAMVNAELTAPFKKLVSERLKREFGDQGVFVRSSTNAEDLAGFNGAGLYTTVPNVKGDEQLYAAIKTVWASVWNFEAFKAREQAGMDHFEVQAGVLIQLGLKADSAGVLITENPYRKTDRHSVFINAKKGLGIKVVNGEKIPEQILFNSKTGAVVLLSRSEEKTFLTFDKNGGIVELPNDEVSKVVLTDALVKKLVRDAREIRKHFNGISQDIEWVVEGGKVWIVQARPYIG